MAHGRRPSRLSRSLRLLPTHLLSARFTRPSPSIRADRAHQVRQIPQPPQTSKTPQPPQARFPLGTGNRRGLTVTAVLAVGALGPGILLDPAGGPAAYATAKPRGHDVSSHQKNVDWSAAKAAGARFVYVKATESDKYRNPYFTQQYNGSRKAGLLRGAYHFALPDRSSGRRQARYFLKHGGRWKNDGRTLPPALDIEENPYGKKCYGLSAAKMTGWVWSFSNEVARQSGRRPVIYTSTKWWNTCTGRSTSFARRHPLWLADWHSSPGPLPAGWSYRSIWQHANSGPLPGDQDQWNGSYAQLKKFAAG